MQAFLHSVQHDPQLWIQPAVVFVITLAITYVIRRLFFRALRPWVQRTQNSAGAVVLRALRGPTHIWNVILAVHFAIQSSALPPRATAMAPQILQVLFILSLTLMFMRIAGELTRRFGNHMGGDKPGASLTQSLAELAVVIIGLLVLLNELNVKITPILTALGVGGLAVALALQDTLSNLFAGMYITVAGQMRLGDYIKLNTGEEGYVSDISWRCTAIRAPANNMIIVPNAKLAQAIITNYSLPEKHLGSSLQVSVSFDEDPDRVEQILLEIVKQGAGNIPGMLAEPAPSVALDPGFGEWALIFSLNFTAADFAQQGPAKQELRKRVLRRFKEEGIEIPYPGRAIHLRGDGPAETAQKGL